MNPDDEFFLVLPSNANTDRYPFNKPTAFTVVVDQAFKLDGTWDVALWSITLPSRAMISDPLRPVELRPIHSMMIYTDVVTDTVIANRMYPLLALVPAYNMSGMYVPKHLAYHRVRQNLELQEVSIKLHDASGLPVELEIANTVVIVELHFKRRTI